MTDFLLSLIPGGGLTAILGGIVAALVAFGTLLYGAKKAGRNEVKAEQAADRLAARSEADKIDQAVAGMTDAEVMREQAKWSRPKR
ncbi:MAG: hypothetical protein H0W39_00945 [Sphingomonas sp.]|nr:hypothetical protein [Sphingomonas sp.]